ncbi:calcium/proton exchanger [Sulfoacidibacillus thermotolerans]|uniref:Ca(2+)/H(+) antiporter n=1 Tax=Sulfoacidibacillus thermotolerans TaxID=1765684 RepID=A0A2U3DAM4_SULT2|nr:calcium/proton exchanger [Sulfoacidibacillus thermotolerans]PWI58334.1 calcium/proton exchanger [Sulfoacidibacillus thermotolerans]
MMGKGWQLVITFAIAGVAYALDLLPLSPILRFLLAALAIIFLARLIGQETERLGDVFGSSVGALLGATFGNAVELLISIIALTQGLTTVVKASIVGSILANLLLTLGLSMIVGGMRRRVQSFNQIKAGVNSVMLFVAVIGLTIMSIESLIAPQVMGKEALSIGIAIVFLIVYFLGFVFSLFTHRTYLAAGDHGQQARVEAQRVWLHIGILLTATAIVAVLSDQIVATLTPLARQLHLTDQFVGLIFVPLIGATPEFFTALLLAKNNRMDGSVEIAVGSSLQVALFVAPVLVLVGWAWGRPLTLVFSAIEVIVVFLATILVSLVSLDGESHWYEGIMVTATYVIFALLFYFS